ncbi:MAG TPA: hypothetical protein PK156_21165 [Polyangium sp.]|nr:hypothetical protein [Polyangium sp.]
MTYAKLADGSGVRGTHYAPGMTHVYYVKNNSAPTTSVGQLARILVTPASKVSEGSQSLTQTLGVNFDTGWEDLAWTGTEIEPLDMAIYKYPQPPAHGLEGIDLSSLPGLSYQTTAIPEDGRGDNYYAGKTASDYYVVFRIYKVQNDPMTHIEWMTFNMNTSEEIVGHGYRDPRDVVISADLKMAYVSAKDGNNKSRVLAVPNAGDSFAPDFTILSQVAAYAIDPITAASPALNATAQIAIDPANPQFIYVVDATGLWRIEPKIRKTKVVDIPNGGMGLLIDGNRVAIISDVQGNLFQVDLASLSPTLIPLPPSIGTLGGPSGFLTWADETKTSFFATVLNPINKLRHVNPQTLESIEFLNLQTLAQPLMNPWSVEVLSPSRLFMATEGEVGTLDLNIAGNALVLGIGLVPFDYIIQDPVSQDRGKADTTSATGYFYQVNKVPFGGNLNLMINHRKAHDVGLRHFRVTLKQVGATVGKVLTDSFTDLLWKSVGGTPKFYATPVSSTGAAPSAGIPANAYPVRSPDDLWYNAHLGTIMPARSIENAVVVVRNGLHEVKVEFFDQNGQLVVSETKTYVILLDNNLCNAHLELPRIGNPPPAGYPTPDCGCIAYANKNDKVALDFKAWQLNGAANYTLALSRGGKALPHLTQTGTTNTSSVLQTKTTTNLPQSPTFKVGHLLGDCNIASIRVEINVQPRAIDGYRWVGALSGRKTLDFTLVPSSISMSTPWVDPGG